MIYRLTSKVALTNFNGIYITFVVFGVLTLVALAGGIDRFPAGSMLFSLSLVIANTFGLVLGTTLAEIKVKPLSWCLPGQERSIGPTLAITAALGAALCASLLLVRPIAAIPLWEQWISDFCFTLGFCLAVAILAVVTRDTVINTLVGMILFLLLMAGMSHDRYAAVWVDITTVLADSPFWAMGFMAASLVATLFGLSRRSLSHQLCGAPFLPLKAQDNPFRIHEYRQKMRQGALKQSVMTRSYGAPGGRLLSGLSRRFAGTSFDYLILDSRITHSPWEVSLKLLYLTAIIGVMAVTLSDVVLNAFVLLFYATGMAFMFFAPVFRVRISPMLPVSRRQHLRAFLLKSLSVYILTVIALVLVNALIGVAAGQFDLAMQNAMTTLPFKGLLIIAISVPILCWGFTTFRSTVGFILFMIFFYTVVGAPMIGLHRQLMMQTYATIALASLVAWLPFAFMAWKRCLRDDLLLP